MLVLASNGSEYFKQHPHFTGGRYCAPFIGFIALEPTPTRVSVGNQDIEEKWCTCIEKKPLVAEKGIMHMKTNPGTRSVGRVSKKDEDHICMYRVLSWKHFFGSWKYGLYQLYMQG